MSKSFFSTDSLNQIKKDFNAFFQFRHFDLIFANNLNSKKFCSFLNVVLNDKIMQQVKRELKRFERQEISQIMFFMKKHYRKILDENVNLHEYAKKKRKKNIENEFTTSHI